MFFKSIAFIADLIAFIFSSLLADGVLTFTFTSVLEDVVETDGAVVVGEANDEVFVDVVSASTPLMLFAETPLPNEPEFCFGAPS